MSTSSVNKDQLQLDISLHFKVMTDEFKALSEVQSADMKMQILQTLTKDAHQANFKTTIGGNGQILTATQGTIAFYAAGGI